MAEATDNEEIVEEEAPLSAEELFELHKAEIDAAFEERGFFRRLRDMFKGLGAPRASAEYKLARTELDAALREIAKVKKTTPIIVKCAEDSPHKALVDVLDICYHNELFSVSVFTM